MLANTIIVMANVILNTIAKALALSFVVIIQASLRLLPASGELIGDLYAGAAVEFSPANGGAANGC